MDKSTCILCILGGPGAGKGTQAELLVKNFNFFHISTGYLLRKESVRPNSPHAEFIRDRIAQGDVVPYDLIISLIKCEMASALHSGMWTDGMGRFILDGFPRDLSQAQSFDAEFSTPSCIYLECDAGILQERCISRGKLTGRSDDVPETIEMRIEAFEVTGKRVVEYYAGLGRAFQVQTCCVGQCKAWQIRVLVVQSKPDTSFQDASLVLQCVESRARQSTINLFNILNDVTRSMVCHQAVI
ncbi:adenylate kinase-domain-containing protein [Gymnopilus junonius]|uniref:Adenylate kinase-domain-containing protein n=1 Tax=Gymnopilus junonius TaxID=109634 RepID=A0A9P5NPT5_GYMJU|nr:adenylate kinase-domain-containing protein [Gymnopilus junonius]